MNPATPAPFVSAALRARLYEIRDYLCARGFVAQTYKDRVCVEVPGQTNGKPSTTVEEIRTMSAAVALVVACS